MDSDQDLRVLVADDGSTSGPFDGGAPGRALHLSGAASHPGSTVLGMAEVAVGRSVADTLQLALDVCLGVGAFWVKRTGAVDATVSDAMPPEDGVRRIAHLASNSLSHPGAAGRELFWNAELSTEADSADRSLACVVVPSWSGDVLAGLLGVVDTWLLEPDAAQRSVLIGLASDLAGNQPIGGLALGGQVAPQQIDLSPTAERDGGGDGGGDGQLGPTARLGLFEPPAPPAGWYDGTEGGDVGPSTSSPVGPVAGGAAGGAVGLGGDPTVVEQLAPQVVLHFPDAVVVTRWDGTIVLVNERFASMAGRRPEDLVGIDVRTLVSAGRSGAFALDPVGSNGNPPAARRMEVQSSTGPPLPVTATDVRLGGAESAGQRSPADLFLTVLRPAPWTEDCAAEARIDCVDLVGNLDDGVFCLDGTGTVALANQAANSLHGLPAGQSLVGSPLPSVSGLQTEDGQPLAVDAHPGMLALRHGTPCRVQLVRGGEGERQQHVTVTARPFPVDGLPGALVVLHDSTSEWLEQQRLTQYALYDPLTGLANRYLLLEELRRMLLLLGRQGGAVALVYLDLDGFKRINDNHGHDMGDEVLAAVARRLRGAVRSDDVVARLGGDEFVIAHASTERLPDGDLVVSRLRKVLSAPFRVRSQAFDVGASIGWVSTDRGEEGPEALVAKADRAMYLQKRHRASARPGPA
jgi:diguanylate cyclase (GGDEF)-like protein